MLQKAAVRPDLDQDGRHVERLLAVSRQHDELPTPADACAAALHRRRHRQAFQAL